MSETLPPGYRPLDRDDARPGKKSAKKKPKGRTDGIGIAAAMDRINRRHGVVLVGGKALVLRESLDAQGRPDIALLSADAFNLWFANEKYEVNGGYVSVGPLWLNSPKRQQYRGICFSPEGVANDDDSGESAPWYNLWKGFAFDPRKGGKYTIFLDHIQNNICQGDKDLYGWVIAWFAHMFQKPTERLGTALVLRGEQGTGKTIIGKIIGRLLGRHYMLIDSPHYLTGNFNAHMKAVILLQADEGFWAGDKEAEGRLKGLVTSDYQMIEAKNVDAVPMRNLVRLLISSNNEWVVPSGFEERRFAVLDVGAGVKQNRAYFREMQEEMEAGGYEALLDYLLTLDLSALPDPAVVPKTDALLEQKIESMNPEFSFWFEALQRGSPFFGESKWLTEIPKDQIFSAYLKQAERIGVKRRAGETKFGRELHKLVPGLAVVRREVSAPNEMGEPIMKRRRCYLVPDLAACRAAFEAKVGHRVAWEAVDPAPGADENATESDDFRAEDY